MKRISGAILLLALLAMGCGKKSSTEMVFDREPPPAGEATTFSFVQQRVFDPSCATVGCHAGARFPDLTAGRAYANIVNQPGSVGLLIAPGDPDNSYLYTKITGGAGMRGSRMPPGTPLPETTIAAVRDWIARGAAND